MNRYEQPDEITEDYIEHICECLQLDITNMMANEGDYRNKECENVLETIRHIKSVTNRLTPFYKKNTKITFNPKEETDCTFSELPYDDEMFVNLMRLAFNIDETIDISSLEIRENSIRAIFNYDD